MLRFPPTWTHLSLLSICVCSDSAVQDSARGIEKATAALDAARADIAALHAVHAKLAALEASFEGRVAETAAAEAARRSAMAAGRGDLQ